MTHRLEVLKELEKVWPLEQGSVLELGAGNTKDFQKRFSHLDWKCTDYDEDRADMMNLFYPKNSYDAVFSCHAFEHITDPLKALKEMARVSRKYVVIATPYHCYHQVLGADDDHYFVLTDLQMERLLKTAGMRKVYCYTAKADDRTEQFWNLITVAEVENENSSS